MIQNAQKTIPDNIKVTRDKYLAEKIVFVNGLPGCGKTMLSPILAALNRVELLTYAYQIEHLCALCYLGKINVDTTAAMVTMWTDLQLYNTMMAREVNFRFSDLSSAFHNHPLRYIRRIFQKGDEAVIPRLKKESPILHLTTHNLLGISEPIFKGLGRRVVFIEVVRHPLYMIKQQALNMERLLSNLRYFTVHIDHNGKALPFWALGWEELFLSSNPVEKAIFFIDRLSNFGEKMKEDLMKRYGANIVTIPFEKFVLDPWPYMKRIEELLGTTTTKYTIKIMKKQRVPRKMYAEGVNLPIYKRCGWEPPKSLTEKEELEARRKFAAGYASAHAMQTLDRLSSEYEKTFLASVSK